MNDATYELEYLTGWYVAADTDRDRESHAQAIYWSVWRSHNRPKDYMAPVPMSDATQRLFDQISLRNLQRVGQTITRTEYFRQWKEDRELAVKFADSFLSINHGQMEFAL